mmetsp:Transcript_13234/g.20034  ORF Transcript_13234/g.20034 Transcript_13234/m.20034 type:complete len:590 (+) Transcript_13234:47-1816(+)
MASPTSANNKQQAFKIGDTCEVYSHSNKQWFQAEIVEEVTTKNGKEFTVRYQVGTEYVKKRVSAHTKDLRSIDASNCNATGKDLTVCVCGVEMQWVVAADCYQAIGNDACAGNPSDDPIDEKSERKSNVSCDGCGHAFASDEQLFHCPMGKSPVHTYGSDLCYKCAKLGAQDEEIQDVADDAIDNDCAIARQLGDEPFSEGSSRYAYLGLWTVGKKKGTRCVIKKYKNKHWVHPDGFEGDIKCYKLAHELVRQWNELRHVNKKYEIVVPVIGRKGGAAFDFSLDLLLLLLALDVDIDATDREQLKKHFEILDPAQQVNNQIKSGEVVMIEDFLSGEFLKWNSNSGWVGDENVTVQAFCHWTYHYSKGEFLFCDAQGVRKAEKYILTDPAILSHTEQGGVYGATDCGKHYLLNWFRTHRCNKFCDSQWKKPSLLELNSVQQSVRKSMTRATSFNKSVVIKSTLLADADIDEKAPMQRKSINVYEDAGWAKYDRYLSWQNGERIIVCSNVNVNQVLLLSNWQKLYVLDPAQGPDHANQHEFPKKQVMKAQAKAKDELVVYLNDDTMSFRIASQQYPASQWKQLIDTNMECQ